MGELTILARDGFVGKRNDFFAKVVLFDVRRAVRWERDDKTKAKTRELSVFIFHLII